MLFIILPVHNRLNQTLTFLDSLYQQTFTEFKIILVNDGSDDGTGNFISLNFPDIIVLNGNGNLFWGGAINLGIDYVVKNAAINDLVAFANNDIVFFNSTSLNSIISKSINDPLNMYHSLVINSENVCISSGSRLISWPFFITKHPARYTYLKNLNFDSDYWVNLATARFLVFNVNMFNFVNQIDSRFPHYLGDVDFSYNLFKKNNVKTFIDSSSIVRLNTESTGMNAGNLNTLFDFIISLNSIRSSNNLNYRFKFALKNCNKFFLPFFLLSTFIKILISNFIIKDKSH
jgi:GT2 family glycosyltransferase